MEIKKKHVRTKRILGMLLVMAIVVGLFPMSVAATENPEEGFEAEVAILEMDFDEGNTADSTTDMNLGSSITNEVNSVGSAAETIEPMLTTVAALSELSAVHTVTYNAPGDTFTDGNRNSVAVEVIDGEKVVRKYVNGRSNASQIGWLTEDGEIFDFNTPITSDIVLTIKWLFNPTANPASGELKIGGSITVSSATEGATFEYIIGLGLIYTPTDGEIVFKDSDFDANGNATLFVRSIYGNTKSAVVRFYYTKAAPEPDPDPALTGIDSMTASWFTFDKNNVTDDGNGNFALNVNAIANLGGIAFQRIVFAVDNVPDGAVIVCEAGWRYADGRDDYWPHQNERNLTLQGGNLYMSPHNNTNLTTYNINVTSAIYRLSIGGEVIGTFVISYTAPVVTVTYDADNGTDPVQVSVNGGMQLSEPARPVKEGHTFKGWYLDGKAFSFGVVFGTYVTSDITLVAAWEANTYTVTYISDDEKYSEEKVVHGNTATAPADPEKDGYMFIGWELNDELFDFAALITGNTTLTAAWEEVPVIISVASSAAVDKLSGNQNMLHITVTEIYSDGSEKTITWSGLINNNAAGFYEVGSYSVYVDTKGNDQIRECYIVI